jgi:hypothetical protein
LQQPPSHLYQPPTDPQLHQPPANPLASIWASAGEALGVIDPHRPVQAQPAFESHRPVTAPGAFQSNRTGTRGNGLDSVRSQKLSGADVFPSGAFESRLAHGPLDSYAPQGHPGSAGHAPDTFKTQRSPPGSFDTDRAPLESHAPQTVPPAASGYGNTYASPLPPTTASEGPPPSAPNGYGDTYASLLPATAASLPVTEYGLGSQPLTEYGLGSQPLTEYGLGSRPLTDPQMQQQQYGHLPPTCFSSMGIPASPGP